MRSPVSPWEIRTVSYLERIRMGWTWRAVQVLGPNTLKMRVWERGSGETMACGTGACASAVAAVLCGSCKMGADIVVRLRGGDLVVNYTEDRVLMTGEAREIFEGSVEV